MREIQSTEAKARFAQLLDDVEQGETIVITRHGRPVARIVPENEQRSAAIAQAIANIQAMRKETGRLSLDEILSARHEGHRY